jgi:hypothetical protein
LCSAAEQGVATVGDLREQPVAIDVGGSDGDATQPGRFLLIEPDGDNARSARSRRAAGAASLGRAARGKRFQVRRMAGPGLLGGLAAERPFRAPHHTSRHPASSAAGRSPRPAGRRSPIRA